MGMLTGPFAPGLKATAYHRAPTVRPGRGEEKLGEPRNRTVDHSRNPRRGNPWAVSDIPVKEGAREVSAGSGSS